MRIGLIGVGRIGAFHAGTLRGLPGVGPPEESYGRWKAALALPGVRGFVIGRALLYPHDGDVAAAVDAACALVRDLAVRP